MEQIPGFVINLNCIGDSIIVIGCTGTEAHTRSIKMLHQTNVETVD